MEENVVQLFNSEIASYLRHTNILECVNYHGR